MLKINILKPSFLLQATAIGLKYGFYILYEMKDYPLPILIAMSNKITTVALGLHCILLAN